jgi:flagellin
MSGAKVTFEDADGVKERGAFRNGEQGGPHGFRIPESTPGTGVAVLHSEPQERNKMSLGILTNTAAIYAENNLNQTQTSLQNTLTQLSSGSRINSGSDDAAGLSVVDGLQANVAALSQSSQNASDGIGLLQTADGALSQVTNLLNRAVTLATESANGTLNSNQVSSANAEYQNILTEIGNIGSTTNFNGNSVFTSTAKTVFVSDGTSSGATSFSETVGSLTKADVGVSAPSAGTTTAGTQSNVTNPTGGAIVASTDTTSPTATFTFGAATDTVGGSLSITSAGVNSGAAVAVSITAGSSIASTVTQLNTAYGSDGLTATQGTGSAANTIIVTGQNDGSGTAGTNDITVTGSALTQTTAATTTGATTVAGSGTDFTATGVATLTAATAATVLTTVTAAIGNVAYQRGIIGADVNELTAASNVASAESVNLTSAQSSIQSTDYGAATSNLAKYQVLSQTGISALAQANSVQQEVLKLLQ